MTLRRIANGVAWRAFRRVFGQPAPDPALGWRGTARDDLDVIRVLHVGDCGLRAMENGHDYRAPLGYPAVAAERLLEQGVGMEFSRWFAVLFEHLPPVETLKPHVKLSGPPDVVLLQVGAAYFRRVLTMEGPLTSELRDELARRAGPRCYPWYAVTRRLTRIFGHSTVEYHGTEALERFIIEAKTAWPDAAIAILLPYEGKPKAGAEYEFGVRLFRAMMAAGERTGAEVIRFRDVLGYDMSLRCANSYNLNARGSEILGEHMADWLLARRNAEPDDVQLQSA